MERSLRSHRGFVGALARWSLPILPVVAMAACGPEPDPIPELVVSARADNDLVRVLEENGWRPRRVDTPAEAIAEAPDGGAVLLLADGYPENPVAVDDDLLDAAARRGLRCYVEFPASLPGRKVGPPAPSGVERAVVSSDRFSPALKRGRILAIHGLFRVDVEADSAYMVLARVAGFDSAAFGLPRETTPLLFEDRPGRLLVATTKLSHFVTGRYAPQEAWATLWRGILSWLAGGRSVPALDWVPTVRPAFGPRTALPSDAEREALTRGVDWFFRSKLLVPESRLEEVVGAMGEAAGLARTPGPEAPIGDGSLGLLEGPLSYIQPDGSQLQSVVRRSDCIGESAMALALAGTLHGDAHQSLVARQLLDFVYVTSEARKHERADPAHGAYGLIAWGISSPAWMVANYGDDNARLLLATMAAAAAMGEDRWDEAVLMALLANLRTTGRNGFRGGRIDIPELTERGWRPFFERDLVHPAPHFEAYLWACYLWAYDKTGFPLFLERARSGIGQTMAAYPDGLIWTNGLAQERARLLLPLAWLVRVDDTPAHRDWLHRVVADVRALQDPSGAIREELGALERGKYPPPQSNEAYGGNEASLIQRNGDPVADLLYTTNFVFLGLHEAAAVTGDPAIRAAEDRLADFLIRTQVRSDDHPSLDGGWFRAFDFRRWEAWGSNADAGWGAWAIESGWTQGWITSVLALRQMDRSLWELTADSRVARHFEPLRERMLPGTE